MSFRSSLGIWRMPEVPYWSFASLSCFGCGHWSLIDPWSEFWLFILIFKVQGTSTSFKSSFWALEDAGGFWLGFDILILIWLWSGTLLGSSMKFWSHSDKWKSYTASLELEQLINIQISYFRGWVGGWGWGINMKLRTAQLRLSQSKPHPTKPCKETLVVGIIIICPTWLLVFDTSMFKILTFNLLF